MTFKSLLTFLVLVFASAMLVTYAQDEKPKPKFANSETKKVKALSKQFGDRLRPINELLVPEECNEGGKLTKEECDRLQPGNFRKAFPLLQKMENNPKWKSHEKAHLFGTLGYVSYQLDNTNGAINYYLKAINEEDISTGVYTNTLRTIGQLYLSIEDYHNAIKYLKQWMDTQESIDATIFAIISQAYYNLEDYNNSLKHIEIAIGKDESSKGIAKENWYGIQRAIYAQRKNYKKVIQILEKLIVHYPKVNYWLELGGMYSELEQDDKRHAAYDLVNLMKGLDSESRLMGLAYMYLSSAPYTSAQLISKGMKDKIIERSVKNLQVAGSAYAQSRDYSKAIPFLEEAAEKDSKGESYARLADVYASLNHHNEAITAGNKALKMGGIKRPDLLKLSIGTALFDTREYDKALEILKTIKSKSLRKSRDSWVRHVRNEIKREKQLKDSGIDLSKIQNTAY